MSFDHDLFDLSQEARIAVAELREVLPCHPAEEQLEATSGVYVLAPVGAWAVISYRLERNVHIKGRLR